MSTTPDWAAAERERARVAQEARTLPREPTSRWVLAVVGVCTLALLALLAWQVVVLPERVPQHWGSSGTVPDRWASKTEALAMSVLLPLVFAYPMPLLSRLVTAWPDGITIANKDWWLATPRRIVRFERLLREDLWLCTAWMLVLLVAVDVHITIAAGRPGGELSFLPVGVLLAIMLVALFGYIAWMTTHRYADDPTL